MPLTLGKFLQMFITFLVISILVLIINNRELLKESKNIYFIIHIAIDTLEKTFIMILVQVDSKDQSTFDKHII